MAHKMTSAELARYKEAFATSDFLRDGSIATRDLPRVMGLLGERMSSDLRSFVESCGEDAEDRLTFDEFLNVTVGPPWEAGERSPEQMVLEAFENLDDPTGYAPMQDVIRSVESLFGPEFRPEDKKLVQICHEVLDVSMLKYTGGAMTHETIWNIFDAEFEEFQKKRTGDSVDGGSEKGSACSSGSQGLHQPDHHQNAPDYPVRLIIADISGSQRMSRGASSTWLVGDIKQDIESALGIPIRRQALVYAGRVLSRPNVTLAEAGVPDGASLTLVEQHEVKVDYMAFAKKFHEVCRQHMFE